MPTGMEHLKVDAELPGRKPDYIVEKREKIIEKQVVVSFQLHNGVLRVVGK